MEKLLIISCNGYSSSSEDRAMEKVNKHLEEGWRVKMISSTAAGGGESPSAYSWAFVVLEKDGE